MQSGKQKQDRLNRRRAMRKLNLNNFNKRNFFLLQIIHSKYTIKLNVKLALRLCNLIMILKMTKKVANESVVQA